MPCLRGLVMSEFDGRSGRVPGPRKASETLPEDELADSEEAKDEDEQGSACGGERAAVRRLFRSVPGRPSPRRGAGGHPGHQGRVVRAGVATGRDVDRSGMAGVGGGSPTFDGAGVLITVGAAALFLAGLRATPQPADHRQAGP